MKTKAVGVFSSRASLPSGDDSPRPAAVQGAAEPRHSEPLTARTAGNESRREGRTTGMVKKFRDTEPAERFFQGGMTSSIPAGLSTDGLGPEIPKLTAGELEALMRRLNLAQTRRIHQQVADRAEKEQWSYRDFLAFLFAEEVAHRQQTRLMRLTRKAHFPFFKTIEEFDLRLQSTLRKTLLGSYLGPDFVNEGRSLILHGKEGRGKTHLAVAIGYRAIQNGFETLCTTAAKLIEDLSNASQKGQLQDALLTYTHPHVLVVDEVGYLSYGPDAANVLFHVVNHRYLKKRPMIFTTNKPLRACSTLPHDEDLANRVLERGRFIHLDGPSGRTGHLNLEEALPETADRARISGISPPQFPERKGTLKSTRPGLWCPWRITELGPKLAFFSGFDIGSFIPTTSRFIPALSGLPVIQQVASVRSSRSTRRLVGTNRAKNRWSMRFASWRDGLARGMKGWCKEFGAGQGMEYISQRSGCRKLLSRLLFGFLFGWRNDLQFQVLHQFLFALIFK